MVTFKKFFLLNENYVSSIEDLIKTYKAAYAKQKKLSKIKRKRKGLSAVSEKISYENAMFLKDFSSGRFVHPIRNGFMQLFLYFQYLIDYIEEEDEEGMKRVLKDYKRERNKLMRIK